MAPIHEQDHHLLSPNIGKMGTIHVNTDLMRQLGRLFVQLNEQIADQIEPQIQNRSGGLENDWQRESRDQYEQMYQDWRASTRGIVQAGEQIGQHLQETAQRFEEADQ